MLFASKKKLKHVKKMKIVCSDNEIVVKDSVRYLGVTINQDMSGTSMSHSVLGKVNED